MIAQRWNTAFAAWRVDRQLAAARRRAASARERAGRAFRETTSTHPGSLPEPVGAALARVSALEDRRQALVSRLAASFETDRRDYTDTASAWGRWLVVVRGALDRLVLREEARRARRELPRHYLELASFALVDPELALHIPADLRSEVELARESIQRAERERAALIDPVGGEPAARWLLALRREGRTFVAFVWTELSKKLVLRLPAIGAMLVAWWIARNYTTSWVEAGWHDLTGKGRKGISDAAMERMHFWLPLLAAAFVAYLSTYVSKRVRRRYLLDRSSS